jgi:tRNA (guanine-N7-)-methyltransferase
MTKNIRKILGAGDGNRTHAKSLGSSYSTIELHPLNEKDHDNASMIKNHPPIRSTVLRQGRMTKAQQRAIETGWKEYGVNYDEGFNLNHHLSSCVLEIGFGMGESLFIQAKNNPEIFFIGIEVHEPGIGSLILRCQQEKLSNIKIFNHDAREVLLTHIPNKTLDKIQIFFPDPWPKKRHHKRRLIQEDFLILCHQKLKPFGIIHIATDWQDYAENIKQLFSALTSYYHSAESLALHLQRPETKFERRGKKLSHVISDLIYQDCTSFVA